MDPSWDVESSGCSARIPPRSGENPGDTPYTGTGTRDKSMMRGLLPPRDDPGVVTRVEGFVTGNERANDAALPPHLLVSCAPLHIPDCQAFDGLAPAKSDRVVDADRRVSGADEQSGACACIAGHVAHVTDRLPGIVLQIVVGICKLSVRNSALRVSRSGVRFGLR